MSKNFDPANDPIAAASQYVTTAHNSVKKLKAALGRGDIKDPHTKHLATAAVNTSLALQRIITFLQGPGR